MLRSRPFRISARGWLLLAAALLVVVGAAATVFVHPLAGLAVVAACIAVPLVILDIGLAFLAVVAVIVLLPFSALPFGIGFKPTFLDLTLAVLYVIWTVRLATRQQKHAWPPLSAGVLLFAGLAVAAFLAGLAQGTPTNNQIRVFGELMLGLGLYFVVSDLVPDRKRLSRVFLALTGLGFAAALIGLALYALPDQLEMTLLSKLSVVGYPSGTEVLRYLNDDPSRLQRATGTSIDPNSFGGMLAVLSALVLPQLISRRPLIPRRAAGLMALVLTGALLATVSRGSLVGLAAAVVVVGLVRDRRLLAASLAVAGAVLGLAGLSPWTRKYVEHFGAGLALLDRATLMRLGEYKDAVRLIGRYPTLGIGFGDVRDADLYRGVSSLYLIVAETMGLVGLSAFLSLMAAVASRIALAWRAASEDDPLRPVLLGSLAALAAALASGVFDHYFFTYPHAFALLWLLLGMAMSAVRLVEAEPSSVTGG